MASNLGWLPDELEIVALRIAWADECAYEVAQLAGQWDLLGLPQTYPVDWPTYPALMANRALMESLDACVRRQPRWTV